MRFRSKAGRGHPNVDQAAEPVGSALNRASLEGGGVARAGEEPGGGNGAKEQGTVAVAVLVVLVVVAMDEEVEVKAEGGG